MRVLSLGWGVQSWTLAAMNALGEFQQLDAAVHSDTMHERAATYDFAERKTPWLRRHGIEVVTVQADDTEPIDKYGGMMIPAFVQMSKDAGQMSRQCTQNWKRAPLRRWLQANRNGEKVELWFGISMDEWHRMKDSDVKYITHRWPLIERKMTRADCINWLIAHNLEVPVKSSCVFCPYHNKKAWQDMKREGGDDWQKAVKVDEQIRNSRPPYPLYVHSARKPLPEAVKIPEDEGAVQLTMLDDTACDGGYCFL